MTVRIDEIETDIDVQGDAPQTGGGAATSHSPWQAQERVRELTERQQRDEARTRSRDHDD